MRWAGRVQYGQKHILDSLCWAPQATRTMKNDRNCHFKVINSMQTRYVDSTLMSEVTLVTIRYIQWSYEGHTHGHHVQFTSLSFHINQPSYSWNKAIPNFDLEMSRSWSHVWPKSKVIQLFQYLIDLIPFPFISIRPTIPEIQLFKNLTLKNPRSMLWVRLRVKVT